MVVEVYADQMVNAQARALRLQVWSVEEEGASARTVFDDEKAVMVDSWPRRHTLAPKGGDSKRRYLVKARALDEAGEVVAEAKVISGYVAGQGRILRIGLEGGTCLGVVCTDTTTCQGGLCLEIPEVDPGTLPPLDSRPPTQDAGADGSPGGNCVADQPCSPGIEVGECEEALTVCQGTVEVCTVRLKSAGTECRPAENECDVAESCNGTSPDCPADVAMPFATPCGTDQFCINGLCGDCAEGVECTDPTFSACQTGTVDCSGATPACTGPAPSPAGTICREAAGLCDVAETCNGIGTTCPDDTMLTAGTPCRDAAGVCDVAEYCAGDTAACPTNFLRPTGHECNPAQGLCDAPEVCSGSIDCPEASGPAPAGTPCRSAGANDCDVTELCEGTAFTCPDDALKPFGAQCQDGVCNGEGLCTDPGCGAPCATTNPCESGVVECPEGGVPTCVGNGFKPAGEECRPVACDDPAECCDVAEVCTGDSVSCPADVLKVAFTECRPIEGGTDCDVPELCSGTSPECPPDVPAPATQLCRDNLPSELCDKPEYCTGDSKMCPEDGLQPLGYSCRGAEGNCDTVERCDGVTPVCPVDGVDKLGTSCLGGYCNGSAKTCTKSIVISEVYPAGSNGFIELYNRSSYYARLSETVYGRFYSSCSLSTNGAKALQFPSGTKFGVTIPPYRFYKAAWSSLLFPLGLDFNLGSPTDPNLPLLSRFGGSVSLSCADNTGDAVAWGTGSKGGEGTRLATPSSGNSYERKVCSNSTSVSMVGAEATSGNSYDSNNNANDFVRRSTPGPQYSKSSAETAKKCIVIIGP